MMPEIHLLTHPLLSFVQMSYVHLVFVLLNPGKQWIKVAFAALFKQKCWLIHVCPTQLPDEKHSLNALFFFVNNKGNSECFVDKTLEDRDTKATMSLSHMSFLC